MYVCTARTSRNRCSVPQIGGVDPVTRNCQQEIRGPSCGNSFSSRVILLSFSKVLIPQPTQYMQWLVSVVRERPLFTTTVLHFLCHRHVAPSVVTHQSMIDVKQDSAARIPMDQYQFDHHKHAELRASRSTRRLCIP
jgi:hypothetical protein